ncbi:MAG: bifunctional aspartate kinase/homoserine dehydrogenase I [Saprospiraceae bacterium]|nr:bifunctional aspartate kinase/homoserine dehydrogenase I [Saprospiraceae bacterium]
MKVLKFGGSSVGSPESIKSIIEIVNDRIAKGEELVLVFSAFSKVTDQLIEMAELASKAKDYEPLLEAYIERHAKAATELGADEALLQQLEANHADLTNLLVGVKLVMEVSPRTMDYVLSFGERNSNLIITSALQHAGVDATYVDARTIIKTNKDFGAAKVNFKVTNELIKARLLEGKTTGTTVVTGFIGSDVGGLTTTLGRGGSDYTAAILASGLDAEILEIWTDVDGVLTSDPRKVGKAYSLPTLSYAEAMEMSHFGAKVIYPPTIQPALSKGIPIYIKNTFNPTFPGTLISKDGKDDFPSIIKGITALPKITLLRLQGSGMIGVTGISSRLFGSLARAKVNIVLITQASSEHSICLAVADKDLKAAEAAINEEFEKEISAMVIDPIQIEKDLTVMAIVGEKMKHTPGVAGKLFESLGKNGINVIAIAQGSSELNISFVISSKDETKALNAIHDSFFLSDNRRIHLYLVGVGLIGSTLLQQIQAQREELIKNFQLEINVVGIANSKKMVFDEDGIDLSNWKQLLSESKMTSSPSDFVDHMNKMNMSNSVFIDCTANKEVPLMYDRILKASISIATPNKVATSSSYEKYLELKKLASDRKIHFKYETNVGAGLPVISTIQNLINSGDKVFKIEAVVSGSLSYIFNNFDGSRKFSDLVTEARELGFTEPDPREDLSGADVKRKLIILTREMGFSIEPDDVVVHPILPDAVMNAADVDDFFVQLIAHDYYFDDMIKNAVAENKVIRFVGVTENGKASVSLQQLGPDSPFYSLASSDNMFVITSNRYNKRPLKVSGPGAGAEVTAAGVFADVLMMFQ